jgi:hypothetical protein
LINHRFMNLTESIFPYLTAQKRSIAKIHFFCDTGSFLITFL